MNDSTRAVLEIMRVYDGACPLTFNNNGIYSYSNRIFDLRHKHGYKVGDRRCRSPIHRHAPDRRIMEYYIEEGL